MSDKLETTCFYVLKYFDEIIIVDGTFFSRNSRGFGPRVTPFVQGVAVTVAVGDTLFSRG